MNEDGAPVERQWFDTVVGTWGKNNFKTNKLAQGKKKSFVEQAKEIRWKDLQPALASALAKQEMSLH